MLLLLWLLLWLQSDSSSCETFGPVHCSAHVDVFTHDLVGMGFVVLVLSHATKTFPIVLNAVIAVVVMVVVDAAVVVIVIILETCFVSRSATVIVVVQKIAFVHHAAADHVRVLSRERRKRSIALGGGGAAVGIGGQGRRSSSRGGR